MAMARFSATARLSLAAMVGSSARNWLSGRAAPVAVRFSAISARIWENRSSANIGHSSCLIGFEAFRVFLVSAILL